MKRIIFLALSLISTEVFAQTSGSIAQPDLVLLSDVKAIAVSIRNGHAGPISNYQLDGCGFFTNCQANEIWSPVSSGLVSGCVCSPIDLALKVPKIREAVISQVLTKANLALDPVRRERLWAFDDLPESDLLSPFIRIVSSYKLMFGYVADQQHGIFGANDSLTREQAAIALARRYGFSNSSDPAIIFKTAVANGYMVGCAAQPNSACPAEAITRGEFAYMMAAAANWNISKARQSPIVFGDVTPWLTINTKDIFNPVQLFGDEYIKFSVGFGYNPTLGYNPFGPRDPITRGQAAVFFARSLFPTMAPLKAVVPPTPSPTATSVPTSTPAPTPTVQVTPSPTPTSAPTSTPTSVPTPQPTATSTPSVTFTVSGLLKLQASNGKIRAIAANAFPTSSFQLAITGNNRPAGIRTSFGIPEAKLYYAVSGLVAGNYTFAFAGTGYEFTPKSFQLNRSLSNIDFVAKCALGYGAVETENGAYCKSGVADIAAGLGGSVTMSVEGCLPGVPCDVSVKSTTKSARSLSTSPLTYQWYKNGRAISGAAKATYTEKIDKGDDGATFVVKLARGEETSTTSPVAIDVQKVAPDILHDLPETLTITDKSRAVLQVKVNENATRPLKYSWSVKLPGKSEFRRVGAGSTLKFRANKRINGAEYKVQVSNSTGKVISKILKLSVQ